MALIITPNHSAKIGDQSFGFSSERRRKNIKIWQDSVMFSDDGLHFRMLKLFLFMSVFCFITPVGPWLLCWLQWQNRSSFFNSYFGRQIISRNGWLLKPPFKQQSSSPALVLLSSVKALCMHLVKWAFCIGYNAKYPLTVAHELTVISFHWWIVLPLERCCSYTLHLHCPIELHWLVTCEWNENMAMKRWIFTRQTVLLSPHLEPLGAAIKQ